MGHLARLQTLPTLPFHLATVGLCVIYFVYIRYVNRPKYNITPTHLEVSEDALMLKNVAFDSLATALAWKKEKRFYDQSRVYLATRLTIHNIIKFII